jgi:hypothetical protein
MLLPGIGGRNEGVGEVTVRGGLLEVTGAAMFEQLAARLAQFGEDRTERVKARHDLAVGSRHVTQQFGGAAVLLGSLTQLSGIDVNPVSHSAFSCHGMGVSATGAPARGRPGLAIKA